MLNLLLAADGSGTASEGPADPEFDFTNFLSNFDADNGQGNHVFTNDADGSAITNGGTSLTAFQGSNGPNGIAGWSYWFNGTNSGLTFGALSDFTFAGDFTVRFRFKRAAGGATVQALIGTGHSTSTPWEIFFDSAGIGLTATTVRIKGSTPIPLDTWQRCALVRSGSTVTLYLNGVSQGTWTFSNIVGDSVTLRVLRIGNANNTARWYSGLMTDVNIEHYAITLAEIESDAKYNPGASTKLFCCHKAWLANHGTTGEPIAVNGDLRVYAEHPYLNSNEKHDFNKHGGSITMTSAWVRGNKTQAIGTQSFTIQGWVMLTSNNSSSGMVTSYRATDTVYGMGLLWATDRRPQFFVGRNATGQFAGITSPTAMALNIWYHVAGVRDGTAIRIYVNGKLKGTSTDTPRNLPALLYAFGNYYSDNTTYLSPGCKVANVELVVGQALYSGDFEPPTQVSSVGPNTALLNKFNKAGVFDAAGRANFRLYNNAAVSTTYKMFGPSSLLLNGTNQYAESEATPAYYLPSNVDWTFEGFAYPLSLAAEITLMGFGDGGTSFASNLNCWLNILTTGELEFAYSNGTARAFVTTTGLSIGINSWFHYAVVYNGTTKTVDVYAKGIRGYTGAISTFTPGQRIPRLTLGRRPTAYSPAGFFNGALDMPRIKVGKKLYTGATYTVPTAAFPVRKGP